jgi:xanthine dehydrogenase YagR molybdenum-binding subunit
MFALETAMDELAQALRMDPVELRRVNDTQRDPIKGVPYTTRSLMPCFDRAAERFGWKARTPEPGSMRDGDWLVGYGCATAAYSASIATATARVTLAPSGRARVEIAAHELGTGTYTILAMVAADRLGVAIDKVDVAIGDSRLPPAGLAAGSSHAASICNAVAKACGMLRERIARAAAASDGVLAGSDPAKLRLVGGELRDETGAREPLEQAVGRLSPGALEAYAENVPPGAPRESLAKLYGGKPTIVHGPSRENDITYTFGAQFAEVRVHRLTREIRVPRLVGAFAGGTIVNPVTAHSQLMGGMIWGLGCALLEETEIDERAARYVNDNIAEYLVAVNADVRSVEVILVPEEDHEVNPLGIKGLGEVGIVGMNAAIANAVHHATGVRIRELPLRLDRLLERL